VKEGGYYQAAYSRKEDMASPLNWPPPSMDS